MAIPSRATSHGTFFITSPTYARRRLFQLAANAQLFLETLQHYRREGHYKLHAFVVMPDHVHLLLTPQIITIERASNSSKEASPIAWVQSFLSGREASRIAACATERII